jgi:hypothetical protein
MPIEFQCPGCGSVLKAPDQAVGRRAKCNKCGASVIVPQGTEHAWPPGTGPATTGKEKPPEPPAGAPSQKTSRPAPPSIKPPEAPPKPNPPIATPIPPRANPAPPAPPVLSGGLELVENDDIDELLEEAMTAPRSPLPVASTNPYRPPLVESERPRRKNAEDDKLTTLDMVLAFVCSPIACILGLIWVIRGQSKGPRMVAAAVLGGMASNALFCGAYFLIVLIFTLLNRR